MQFYDLKMEIKLVTNERKNVKNIASEIWTHDVVLTSFIPYQLWYVIPFKIKRPIKAYGGCEHTLVFLKYK